MRHFLKSWLPVIAWMIFIFIGSTDLLSAEHTSRFIGPFLRWLSPNVSDATIGSVQLVVRKCAHLSEYAILGGLLCRALRQHRDRVFLLAFIIAALYAALDEFHQSVVATRTASPWDVAIDCAGGLLGLVAYSVIQNRKSKIQNAKGSSPTRSS